MATIPEVVNDGQTGILVPPGDVQALAGALERLLGNEDLLQHMGQETLAWAETFSWERCARESYGD